MNKRVHEIAKEQGLAPKDVLARLREAGIEVKASSSSVDEDVARRVLANGGATATVTATAAAPAKAKPKATKPKPQSAKAATDGTAKADAPATGPKTPSPKGPDGRTV